MAAFIAILLCLFGIVFPILWFLQKRKNSKLKKELELIKSEKDEKSNQLKVMEEKVEELNKYYPFLREQATKYQKIENYEELLVELERKIEKLNKQKNSLDEIVNKNIQYIDLEESGFYRYQYNFEDIDKYSDALRIVKETQKVLINANEATVTEVLELADSPIIKSISKIGLMAFNAESEAVIRRVKYNNFDSCVDRIVKLFDIINKNMSPLRTSISKDALDLKIKELTIGLEFEEEKKRIKDEQDELRAQMKEEESARVEAEKARAKAIEEEEEYAKALDEARKEIAGKTEDEKNDMLKKIEELELKLKAAHDEKERATSMAQITKAGHVYIISNIGSFGDNVFKIGMTRRKDPMDRVRELGDASVPFRFDVHAIAYSDNAPHLENELHKYFDKKRMNKVNHRKEFFKVTFDEINEACEQLGFKIKLTKLAEAREYYETLRFEEAETSLKIVA